jgi:hypothetical protein
MHHWLIWALLILFGGSTLAQQAVPANASPASAAAPAQASAPETQARRYAVLSLIGDALGVVNNRGQAGSHISTSATMMKMSSPVFDRDALLTVNDILKKSAPGNPPVLLAPTAALYADQAQMIDGVRFLPPAELGATLKSQAVTHLLLISKYRANTTVRFATGEVGSGKLEGLGFYLDHHLAVGRTDSGATGLGFMAPYAYFTMSLVDVQSGAVLKSRPVTATRIVSPATSKGANHAWDVLTSEQKIELIRDMVKEQVTNAIDKLLSN